MSSIRRSAAAALAAACLLTAPAAAQDPQPRGPVLKVNAAEIEIGGRLQTQFVTTSVDGEEPSDVFIRRARLEVRVKVNDFVSGRIVPDFAGNRVVLKDAFIKLTFDPAFEVLVGNAYRPFSLLETTTSVRMHPVERGAVIPGIDAVDEYDLVHDLKYSDRDLGLQVLGRAAGGLGLQYAAGVFRGPVHGEVGAQNSYQYAARASVSPVTDLRVGAAWSSRHFAVQEGGGDPTLRRGHAWEVDAEVGGFDPGFHALAEVARGDFDPFTDATFTGAQGWLAWRSRELGKRVHAVEPMARVSWAEVEGDDPETAEIGGTLLTPGVSVYFTPLTRVQVNCDFWNPAGGGESQRSFKTQFQFAF
jgi:hypothetical protein